MMRRPFSLLFALTLLALTVSCARQIDGANSKVGQSDPPVLGSSVEGGDSAESTGAALGGGEEAVEVSEAAPPGLRIVNIKISPTTPGIRQSTGFKGFRSGGADALIQLPLYGVDPRLGTYYLIVAVGNFGDAPVRNLKGRADFYDAAGVRIWSETQPVTHLPTRLGLNPPSLPNLSEPQPDYDPDLKGFGLYYFPTNIGVFTFNVPDNAVSANIANWNLTFLVSTT